MRRPLMLLAALPLLLAQPALAEERPDAASRCLPPEIDDSYGTDAMRVHVKLPASGCRAREHSMFVVSAGVTRSDVFGPQESAWRSLRCGPFPTAEDRSPDDPPAEYFCELDVILEHPDLETNEYQIEVTYPAATAERTLTLNLVCTSDGQSAVCDKQKA